MAASNMKAVKLRMRSIESTMQITRAMQLVAASKLRRPKNVPMLPVRRLKSFMIHWWISR